MFEVVGLKSVTAKSDGRRYVEIHTISDDKFVTGKRCDSFFIAEERVDYFDALTIGALIDALYNRFGRVERITVFI